MNATKIRCIFFLLCGPAVSAVSQEVVSLDTGLRNGLQYFEGRLPRGTKLAILYIGSESKNLADYVIEEIVGCFVNSNSLTLLERSNLGILNEEITFQLSGEVSDEAILSLGKRLGAQTVLTGSIDLSDTVFRLRIRAIEIETAVIQGQFNANIARDRYLVNLYNAGIKQEPPASEANPNETPAPSRGHSQPSTGGSGVRLPDYLLQ